MVKILSEITEMTHYDPDPNAQPVGNGSFQVKMNLITVVSLAIRQRSRDLFTLPLETGIPKTKVSIYTSVKITPILQK